VPTAGERGDTTPFNLSGNDELFKNALQETS
jgi:hypothetical protein